MVITLKPRFKKEFKAQFDYIAKDSYTNAVKFKDDILKRIELLKSTPYLGRPSHYKENARDLIINGYTIIYDINDDEITIITFFKWNLPNLKEQN